MNGIAFTQENLNGTTSTFATVLDIRWQPKKSADIQVGHFLDLDTYLAGGTPVAKLYFALDISLIDPTLPIPPQIVAQLLNGPLAGGTPV